MKNLTTLLASSCLLCLVVSCGTEYKETNESLSAEKQVLTAENQSLTAANESLSAEKQVLTAKNQSLTAQLTTTTAMIQRLQETEDGLVNSAFGALEEGNETEALKRLDRFLVQFPASDKYGPAVRDARQEIINDACILRVEEIRHSLPSNFLYWSSDKVEKARTAAMELQTGDQDQAAMNEVENLVQEINSLRGSLAREHAESRLLAIEAAVSYEDLRSIKQAQEHAAKLQTFLETEGVTKHEVAVRRLLSKLDDAQENHARLLAEMLAKEEAAKAEKILTDRGFKITRSSTNWVTTAKGFTLAEGLLWVPELRMTIKNTSASPAELGVQAVFNRSDGVVLDDTKGFEKFSAGQTREFILNAGRGYDSDRFFWGMKADEDLFTVDISVSDSYFGEYKKFRTMKVSIPAQYKALIR